jgi:hypothetical protein
MPSPTYQYVINLVASIPYRSDPGVFMDVSVLEHRALNYIFLTGKVYYFNTIIIIHYYPDEGCHSQFWI